MQPADTLPGCYQIHFKSIETNVILVDGFFHDMNKIMQQIIPPEINKICFTYFYIESVEITVRYYHANTFNQHQIIVACYESLSQIWSHIQTQLSYTDLTIKKIKLPVFTLLTTSINDSPVIIYFSDNHPCTYDYKFYSKPQFAKLFNDKINPINKFFNDNICNLDIDGFPFSFRKGKRKHCHFIGDPILCVENSWNLPQPTHYTIAAQQWHEERTYSTIYIDDYTQIEEQKDEKKDEEYKIDNIGSSNINNAKLRKLTWKLLKGTLLQNFFELVRAKCDIDNSSEIRAFSLYETHRYLITFPYKFQLKEHRLMLERGRYPKYTEVFLWVCLINDDTTSQFLPLIVNRRQTVKNVKQSIMKLFQLNPADYKKYVCYKITTLQQKNRCWEDALTLNTCTIIPRHSDQIGIKIMISAV